MNKSNKDSSNQNSDVASWVDEKNSNNSGIELSTDQNIIGTDTTNQETRNQDTTNQDTTNQDTTNQDTTNQDTTNQDTTNQDTTNQDTTNQDTTNQDTTNQDTTNQDTTNQDTTNQDTTNQDTTNTEDTKTYTNSGNNTSDKKEEAENESKEKLDEESQEESEEEDTENKTENERALNELTTLYKNLNKHLEELYCNQDEFDKISQELNENISQLDTTSHSIELAKTKTQQTNIELDIHNVQEKITEVNNTDIDDNSTNKDELRGKIDILKNEIETMKLNENKLKEQNIELENKLKEYASSDDGSEKSNEDIEKIRSEKERINEELKKAENELAQKSEDYNILDQEYNKLQKKQQEELEEKELRVNELKNEEARLNKMLEENKIKYDELNRKNQTELNSYKYEINRLKKELEERERKLNEFENKGELSDKIQAELSELKGNAAKHVITIAEITKKLSEKEAEIEKNKEELLKYQSEKKENLKKIEDLKRNIQKNNGNNELIEKDKKKLEEWYYENIRIEEEHKKKFIELEKVHKKELEDKEQQLNNLIKINEEKKAEQDKIISKLKIDLQNKGVGEKQIEELKKQLMDAENKKRQSLLEMEKKIQTLNEQLRQKKEYVVSPVGSNISSSLSHIPEPPPRLSSESKILNAPYIGFKVAFPKDRISIVDDKIIAPLKGNPLALAIILTRPECWYWQSFIIGTEEEEKDNEKKMREIESIVRNNSKKGKITVDDYVYIHSINDNLIAPATNGIKFSTQDNEDDIIKFARLTKGEINKPLKIVLIHNRKKIIIYVKRLKDHINIPNCLEKYKGGLYNRKKGKKGGGKKERMDFEILRNIKEVHYDNIIKETDKLKNQLKSETENPDLNEKMNNLETYNKKFNEIYIKYEKANLSYENWKTISNVELDNREEFNDNINELKDLLFAEIKKNPKKDYIEINLLENKEIQDKLFALGNKKIYVKCKKKNENESLADNSSDDYSEESKEDVESNQSGGENEEEYNCIPVKLIDDEDCKEIKKLVNDIIKLLNEIRDILGIKPLPKEEDKIYEINDDSKTITGLMSEIRAQNFDPTGANPGNAEILTKSTMMIYNIILGFIVLLCVFTIILHIFNIIKFLHESFLEIGRVQHNNLETGETFRYKLLHYITYINTCKLPSIFSSFNSKETTSETILKLSKIVKQFFKKSEEAGIKGSTEFKDMLNDMNLEKDNDELEDECEIAWSKWLKENPNKGQPSEKERICQEIKDKNKIKKDNFQKEPLFNIFMIMRLFFITIKLYLAFFMIVVIVFVIYVLLTKVAALTNMQTLKMNPFAKQISFMTLLQASGICFIYIITSFLIYKFVFLKQYSKYLETYLHIIAIDFELNKIKRDNDNPEILDNIDSNYAILLHDKIDNAEEIEEKIIQLIEDSEISEKKIVKYIIYYVLIKHIYNGKNKEKLSHLKAYSYFINTNIKSSLSTEILVDINATYFSLIPNKYRKVPLQYYKFNNIKKLSKNIEKAERIRKEVNSKLSILNDYIASINKEFDDDNYIVNLGWFFLINLIISTIFIGILITILIKGWQEADKSFYNFVKMDID